MRWKSLIIVVVSLVSLVACGASGEDSPLSTSTDNGWYYAYNTADQSVYSFNFQGEQNQLITNVTLPRPISGARVGADAMVLGNIPLLSQTQLALGLLTPETGELTGLTVDRLLITRIAPPLVNDDWLVFGVEYEHDDNPETPSIPYVALLNAPAFSQRVLIDDERSCGIDCVRFSADGSQLHYMTANTVGIATETRPPTVNLRLIDHTLADGNRTARYEDTYEGDVQFTTSVSTSADWWLIDVNNRTDDTQTLILVDAEGNLQELPAETTGHWVLFGDDLFQYHPQCESDCVLERYVGVTGGRMMYPLDQPITAQSTIDSLTDDALLLTEDNYGAVLRPDTPPAPILDDTWSLVRLVRAQDALILQRTHADNTSDRAVLRLDNLEEIAILEDVGQIQLRVENDTGHWLLRSRLTPYQVFILPDGARYILPETLNCLGVTADSNLLCQQDNQVVLYNPVADTISVLLEDFILIDGF